MSRHFSEAPNNRYNFSNNMGKSTAQQDTCDSTSTTGSPSQTSQTHSYISIGNSFGCSVSLADASRYGLSSPQFNTSRIAPSFDFDSANFPLGLAWGMDEGSVIQSSTKGDYTDRNFEDENYVDENPTLYTSFQDHKSDSGFNVNDATYREELPDYFTSFQPLITSLQPLITGIQPPSLELVDDHSSALSHTMGGHASSDNGSSCGQTKNPPASPNSNDPKTTKTKKTYQCTEYNCGKIFGRSAELKRHKNSVHEDKAPRELFHCPHEGCERVGKCGFKRKDNLVQHLRGVHGDRIGKKSGRRSATTRMSPWSDASNAGAGSPAMATGYEQFSQGQQEELFVYADQQPTEEGSGTPPLSRDFWESLKLESWEE